MTLDDIDQSIGTVHEEQHKDDRDREATDSTSDDLQQRSMDEYDGGWSADH